MWIPRAAEGPHELREGSSWSRRPGSTTTERIGSISAGPSEIEVSWARILRSSSWSDCEGSIPSSTDSRDRVAW